jgi:hypothetical protein
VAWGAHAYLRGWGVGQRDSDWESSEDAMLPAYIQHGVHTAEAAVMSLFSIPRQVAEPMASVFRSRYGPVKLGEAFRLRNFIETADDGVWDEALRMSPLDASPSDLRVVWRQMRGLPT